MPKAELSEIVNAMEMNAALLDRHSGRVVALGQEELDAAEDDADPADYPQWQREFIELAKAVQADAQGRYVRLPDRFEINEGHMLEAFVCSREDPSQANALLEAIGDRGTFRRFKDRVHELGLAAPWSAFRADRYRETALEWAQDHQIEVDPDA